MEKMKIWFGEEGDFLEIGFGNKKGYFRDVGADIWERMEGDKIKGIAILNFKKRTQGKKVEIYLPIKIQLESVKA